MDFESDYDASQRIKIAQILSNCKSDRLALIAYVLGFDLPQAKEVINQSSNLVKWFKNAFDSLGEVTPVEDVYNEYKSWCEDNNATALTRNAFTHRLKKNFDNFTMKVCRVNGVHKRALVKEYRKEDKADKGGE